MLLMKLAQVSHDFNKDQLVVQLESASDFNDLVKQYHYADLADAIQELSLEKQLQLFKKTDVKICGPVFERMTLASQQVLIEHIPNKLSGQLVAEMESDDAVDLIGQLIEDGSAKPPVIFKGMPTEHADDLKELLQYEGDTAGSLMTYDFISIPQNLTVAQATKRIKTLKPSEAETSYYVFVVDDSGRLVGYTPFITLFLADDDIYVKEIRYDYPIKVTLHTDQEEIAQMFQKYDLVVLPVVDDDGVLEGVITVDDVVDVVIEEANEDMYKMSGTTELDEVKAISGSILDPVTARLPWLFITIFGGILASYLISVYSRFHHPDKVALALVLSFVPLLMGIGGNVGNQSATIIVRGIATGSVDMSDSIKVILRECAVGLTIGVVVSAVVGVYQLLRGASLLMSGIVGVSIICNVVVAALIGASLPLFFHRFKIDPAVASAPFISTTLDIIGQVIYFSLVVFIFKMAA